MINEKMLELLLLADIIDTYLDNALMDTIEIEGAYCDFKKILSRYRTLLREFISPYVIDNDSKE